MRRWLAVLVLGFLPAGCWSRIVVDVPETRVNAVPAGSRVAMVHAKDERAEPGVLGRHHFERFDVRPLPADLVTASLRTALENEGCLVAEVGEVKMLDAPTVRRFLSRHNLVALVVPKLKQVSFEKMSKGFGRNRVVASLELTIIPAAGGPVVREIGTRSEEQWTGIRAIWGPEDVIAEVTARAIVGAVNDSLARPGTRKALGITAKAKTRAGPVSLVRVH